MSTPPSTDTSMLLSSNDTSSTSTTSTTTTTSTTLSEQSSSLATTTTTPPSSSSTTSTSTSTNNNIDDIELICSLAEKGEHVIQYLLLSIHSITKHLQSLQWDPVFLHSIIYSPPAMGNTGNGNSGSNNSGNNVNNSANSTPLAGASPPAGGGTATPRSGGGADQPQLGDLNLNIDSSTFYKDNERMKHLNSQCLDYVDKLQQLVIDIVHIKSKLETVESSNSSTTDATMDEESSSSIDTNNGNNNSNIDIKESTQSKSKELEDLKMVAYKKNCIIKKLIDNMRLLQLSINTMNRANISND
ncbi:hypothetical protein SAMD00019534_055820 [Acytostelium subglobosum LB1]|uniref:hypothetical protein n=1 Tax=Acytostelium subglobosum LB1 TaxID=1410327 RepID=UPI00064514DC|nr:hypothetical protein SAMD00019534_055820 [Acytostelium subglobosum LB1]GAM22407.1 hypothetical protein SAMD00019534_055820 [Acytostelium subglobosum LB1]|eukprot:XP_012754527.1 hypothetical protein SAMD00019534_055820 [Acytostelium subglobosum LB1]